MFNLLDSQLNLAFGVKFVTLYKISENMNDIIQLFYFKNVYTKIVFFTHLPVVALLLVCPDGTGPGNWQD